MPEFTWLPANRASIEDVEAVFAAGGARARAGAGAEGGGLDLAGHQSGAAGRRADRADRVWHGRADVRADRVRTGWRRSGLTYELAAATADYGRQVSARVLEGYPIEPPSGESVIWDEASVGLVQVFLRPAARLAALPTLRPRKLAVERSEQG